MCDQLTFRQTQKVIKPLSTNTLRSPGRMEISIHINRSGIRASQRCKLIIYIRVYLHYDALDTVASAASRVTVHAEVA